VIGTCAKAENCNRAGRWLEEAKKGGMDAKPHHLLLCVFCLRQGGELQEAKKAGWMPNLITYNSVLIACAKAGTARG